MSEQNGHEELPESLGDYGGGVSSTRCEQQTTRIIEQALRENWPINPAMRPAIVERQVRQATSSESTPSEATRAARTLAMMDRQNKYIALKLLDKIQPDRHLVTHESDELREAIEEMRRGGEYAERAREGATERYQQSGLNGRNGQPGPLGNGAPPAED